VTRWIQGKSIPRRLQRFAVLEDGGAGLLEVFRKEELGIWGKNRMIVPGSMVRVSVGNQAQFFPPAGVQPQVQFREIYPLIEYYLHVFCSWNESIVLPQYIIKSSFAFLF
jgi:hypothetical protein